MNMSMFVQRNCTWARFFLIHLTIYYFFVNFKTQLSHIIRREINISDSYTRHDLIFLLLFVKFQPPLSLFSLIFHGLFSFKYLPWLRLQSMGDCNENFEKEKSKWVMMEEVLIELACKTNIIISNLKLMSGPIEAQI